MTSSANTVLNILQARRARPEVALDLDVPEAAAGAAAESDKVATEKVVAFDLGTCHGRRAYLKYVWYFPAYRKPPHSRANSACL